MGKLSKRIEQAVRRRAKSDRPQAEEQIKLTVSDRERHVFTNAHANVLLLVESTLVQIAEQTDGVDDAVIELALRSAIRRRPAADHRAELIAQLLQSAGATKNIDDETMRTAMRVVYTSLRTHSNCESGEYSYLAFIMKWIGNAINRQKIGPDLQDQDD